VWDLDTKRVLADGASGLGDLVTVTKALELLSIKRRVLVEGSMIAVFSLRIVDGHWFAGGVRLHESGKTMSETATKPRVVAAWFDKTRTTTFRAVCDMMAIETADVEGRFARLQGFVTGCKHVIAEHIVHVHGMWTGLFDCVRADDLALCVTELRHRETVVR
jgi:hypothetical protein